LVYLAENICTCITDAYWVILLGKRNTDYICALLGYYAALSGSSVPTFRNNLLVPSARVKKSKKKPDLIQIAAEA
jgi:hypothetical protein